jgi:hypothetical protein
MSVSGKPIELTLNSETKYETVVPAQLSDIKKGDFVGVGVTGSSNDLQALEVHIFPASMRGTGEGHNAWSVPVAVANADRHTTGAAPGAQAVQGTMTNGTVADGSSEAAPPVQGTMTSGTVVGTGSSVAVPPGQGTMTNGTVPPIQGTMTNGTVATGGKAGGQKLAITYNNGKQAEISVQTEAPVVRLTPGYRSEQTPGAKIFALASEGNGSTLTAKSIAVGKNGLMPPM